MAADETTRTLDASPGTGTMGRHHVPSSGLRYWVALAVASILGCNTGDAFASFFGFLNGFPLLAIAFGLILWLERRNQTPGEAFYWLAIIVVRTAATNLADFTAHGMGSVPAIGLLTLFLGTLVYAQTPARAPQDSGARKVALPPVDLWYWATMLIAGTLGTAIGDYVSFGAGLGLPIASLVLSAAVVVALIVGSRGMLAYSTYYWSSIVGIRAAGTAVGDFSAKLIGLAPSVLLFGVLLIAILTQWRKRG